MILFVEIPILAQCEKNHWAVANHALSLSLSLSLFLSLIRIHIHILNALLKIPLGEQD